MVLRLARAGRREQRWLTRHSRACRGLAAPLTGWRKARRLPRACPPRSQLAHSTLRTNCCECDGCLGACPEDAVIKLGPGHRYEFDYGKCTGCGVCYEQCPVHSIDMVPEGSGMEAEP